MSKNLLEAAIGRALHVSGMAGAMALGITGVAQAQNAAPAKNQPQTLQTIVVTGSHIRRVDLETSNPVVAVTAQQIAATGKLTMGDVIQNLPAVAGGVENPSVTMAAAAVRPTSDCAVWAQAAPWCWWMGSACRPSRASRTLTSSRSPRSSGSRC